MSVVVRRLLLLAVLVYGTVVRFDGLTFGLPLNYHPDEAQGSAAVSDCVMGRPISSRYRHPPFLHVIACRFDRYIVAPYTSRYMRHLPHNILSLRTVSAAAGALTVLFVYLLGLRLLSPAGALAAAFLFACFPAAVMSSKYGVPDSLVTMFMTAALWLQMRMLERARPLDYFAAALATTLAVTSKYNGAFVGLSFIAAHLVLAFQHRLSPWSPRHILPSVAAVCLGLAAGFPRVIFGDDGANLAAGVLFEQKHLLTQGHLGIGIGGADGGYVFHFLHSILPAAGPWLLALIVTGLLVLAARRSPAVLVLMAFAVPYYVTIETIFKVPPSFERYVLPLVPMYLIGAVLLLESLARMLDSRAATSWRMARPAVLAAAVVAAAWVPLSRTTAVVARLGDDTRGRMTQWIRANLEPDAEIFVQWPMMGFYYARPLAKSRLLPAKESLLTKPVDGNVYVLASSLMYQRYLDSPADAPGWTSFYRRLFDEGELVHEEDAGLASYMFHNPTLRLYRRRHTVSAANAIRPPQTKAD